MCMTKGCGGVQHSMAQSYTPKGNNAASPFRSHVSRPSKPMTHAKVASAFYGTPTIRSSFRIGKY